MFHPRSTLLVLIVLFALPAHALAAFSTLDPHRVSSKASAQLDYVLIDDMDGLTLTRTDLRLQIAPKTLDNMAFYGYLPLTLVFAEGDNISTIGSPEIGLLTQSGQTTYRLGCLLPFASSDFGELMMRTLTSLSRLTDLATLYPEALSIRAGASHRQKSDGIFTQLDSGLDYVKCVAEGCKSDDAELFLRFNAGAGVDLGSGSLAIESANIANLTSDGDLGDKMVHSLGLTMALNLNHARLALGVSTILDEGVDVSAIHLGITADL